MILEGKTALVTGAAKGIGRAIALALAAEGASVIVNYNGSREKAEQTVEEIRALGAKGRACQCNVADTQAEALELLEILSEEERLIVVLTVFGGYKGEEIARLLHRNHSTVRTKYRRALKKMEQEIERAAGSRSGDRKNRRKEVQG